MAGKCIEASTTLPPLMKPFDTFTELVTAERSVRENYQTLLSCVVPRPIAFVSTVSSDGVANLAPFSFFNAVGSTPPAVMFCPAMRRDGTPKDTLSNLRAVGEFVVNVVPHAIRESMNQTSFDYAPEEDEFALAGFTPLASRFVRPQRVAESPVHMECKLIQIVHVGDDPRGADICIGEILCFHVAGGYLTENGSVDVEKIDLIGRLGGQDYTTIRDRFSQPRPTRPS